MFWWQWCKGDVISIAVPTHWEHKNAIDFELSMCTHYPCDKCRFGSARYCFTAINLYLVMFTTRCLPLPEFHQTLHYFSSRTFLRWLYRWGFLSWLLWHWQLLVHFFNQQWFFFFSPCNTGKNLSLKQGSKMAVKSSVTLPSNVTESMVKSIQRFHSSLPAPLYHGCSSPSALLVL